MKVTLDLFRKEPGEERSRRQEVELPVGRGEVLLDLFHRIQSRIDPGFSYRYSCRGAICGSCAVRINGEAALACKTQVRPLAEEGPLRIDPLANLAVVKDLVCDFTPFWEAYRRVRPFLERHEDRHDDRMVWEERLTPPQLDQLKRCIDCIKCGACFSDCPKRGADETFIGPAACVELYRFFFDPRDGSGGWRKEFAASAGGVVACERHATCVKVCPKDVRPLRAITFMRNKLE